MDHSPHFSAKGDILPEPDTRGPSISERLAHLLGDNRDRYWAEQSVRVASDMILVCASDLTIRFHNPAFLRALGQRGGSYVGFSLLAFFPGEDRRDAASAFAGLVEGRSGGLRIQADLLKRGGTMKIEARATRTRAEGGSALIYLVLRESVAPQAVPMTVRNAMAGEAILDGLEVALVRTDARLRITQAAGSLWDLLGVRTDSLVGADLGSLGCARTPDFLKGVDYCDVMAGLSLQMDLRCEAYALSVTMEPFLDLKAGGKVTGMLGLIRLSKKSDILPRIHHLQEPNPAEFTRPVRIQSHHLTERISPVRESRDLVEIGRIPQNLKPTPMRPAPARDAVALAN